VRTGVQQQNQNQQSQPPPPPPPPPPPAAAAPGSTEAQQGGQTQSNEKTGAAAVEEVTRGVVTGCVVQLLLIDCVHCAFEKHAESLPKDNEVIKLVLDALQASFTFAHSFNQKITLRLELKRLGFMANMRDLPGLLKQEREGLTCYLGILFGLHALERLDTALCERLCECCRSVMKNYLHKDQRLQALRATPVNERPDEVQIVEFERETAGLQPIITQVILHNLLDSKPSGEGTTPDSNSGSSSGNSSALVKVGEEEKEKSSSKSKSDDSLIVKDLFRTLSPTLFPLIADLCLCYSQELRVCVREVLVQKVAPMLKEQ